MAVEGAGLPVGSRLREYEILEQIGRGGMGAVYRARHVYLEEERAIKVVRPDVSEGVNPVDRFIQEARILVRLRHPNLVQLHEFGTLDDGSFIMVVELIRGESVLQRINRLERIPADEAIRIVGEAARGLAAAHALGIVHRDVSPDNLLLVTGADGTEATKVIDFGIAKPIAEGGLQHMLSTSVYVGKPQYSSPEQCGMLEPGEVIDQRSDVYSLAATLYHMLTGKLPFYATSIQGYIIKHVNEAPAPPSSHFPPGQIPADLDAIILRALAKKRADRHGSMTEFLADLERIAGDRSSRLTMPIAKAGGAPVLAPGSLFAGRFLIEKEIGAGGMGRVFKAFDNTLHVPLALKVMHPRVAGDSVALERLKREVILARKVAHRNACRIFDIGRGDGVDYVTMEYVEGKTLSELIKLQGRMNPSDGIPLIRQVVSALREAHNAGVIHRDLKPHNIMVGADWHASVMDFGLSLASGLDRLTQDGMLVGTPSYMAPEQLEGRDFDQRADLYAVGVIMFEVFTGKLPFTASAPVQVMLAHIKTPPPRPTSIVPDLPKELEHIILRLLEKKADDRFQTAGDLLQAFDAVWTPSEMAEAGREVLVHRFMMEHKYAQAIELLGPLLQADPGNAHWNKLLQTALAQMVHRPGVPTRALTARVAWPAAAVCIAIVAVFSIWFFGYRGKHPAPVPPHDEGSTASVSAPAEPAAGAPQLVEVSIDAVPWARVKVIPSFPGMTPPQVPEDEMTTPCNLMLQPGEYTVELCYLLTTTRSETMQARAGANEQFVFTMPGFDAGKIARQWNR
ncbi:MAG: serine/threonine-protein kinase [Acidobacteriota bacterium]